MESWAGLGNEARYILYVRILQFKKPSIAKVKGYMQEYLNWLLGTIHVFMRITLFILQFYLENPDDDVLDYGVLSDSDVVNKTFILYNPNPIRVSTCTCIYCHNTSGHNRAKYQKYYCDHMS